MVFRNPNIPPRQDEKLTFDMSPEPSSYGTQTPAMIRFGAETEDEVYITSEAATRGVEIENNGSEPLVSLRYFGPNTWPKVPNVGDYKNG